MKNPHLRLFISAALMFGTAVTAFPQGTAFTYQGRIHDGGDPANGSYDLIFSLFPDATGSTQIGSTLTNSPVNITNGFFTVALDFDIGIFTGPERWLEVGVRSNGGISFTTLNPRQQLTPTPYAIMANTASNLSGLLPANQLSGILTDNHLAGAYTNAFTFDHPGNTFAGNGAALTDVNAATLNGLEAASFWQLNGNAGTTAGVDFLGTTDNNALELKVNNARALRIEPTATSPNLIGGHEGNYVSNSVVGATIAGGGTSSGTNAVLADFSTISGGHANWLEAADSSIGGGFSNRIGTVHSNIRYSTIGGGVSNVIYSFHSPNKAHYGFTIAGGGNNQIYFSDGSPAVSRFSTISGGEDNFVADESNHSTIGGGRSNFVDGSYCTIGGGRGNRMPFLELYATIGGGQNNTNDGHYGTIPGGRDNVVKSDCFATGRRAKALHTGSFVWADSSNFDFASTNANEFAARCIGGARFVSAIDGSGIPVAGVELPAGGGAWSSLSDRNAKENFVSINPRDVLEMVNRLPIATWNYKSQDATIRHIGPTAQDFAAAFKVGEDHHRITTVDADGVALAAIQGLNQKLEEKNAELQQLKQEKDAEIQQLNQRLEKLERLIMQKPAGDA